MYRNFASIYDDMMCDVDYGRWFDYIEYIYAKENIRPKKILEMACGTGNLTKFLAGEKYDITCFDYSIDMLAVADTKLKSYKNVKILQQDMISFNTGEVYDSIVSTCDSINYITDEEDLRQVFKNVYEHLQDQGVFIFDINSSYYLSEIIGNNNFIEERGEVFYSWESYYDQEEKVNQFYINFFVREESGKYNRFIEEHYERAYSVEELEDLLRSVGFSQVRAYKGFTYEAVDETSERINFIVKK